MYCILRFLWDNKSYLNCVKMSRKLMKFLIMFDNSNLLFFPGQFLTGRVILEVDDDMPVLGKSLFYIIMSAYFDICVYFRSPIEDTFSSYILNLLTNFTVIAYFWCVLYQIYTSVWLAKFDMPKYEVTKHRASFMQ